MSYFCSTCEILMVTSTLHMNIAYSSLQMEVSSWCPALIPQPCWSQNYHARSTKNTILITKSDPECVGEQSLLYIVQAAQLSEVIFVFSLYYISWKICFVQTVLSQEF
jgi:hypothetical protein